MDSATRFIEENDVPKLYQEDIRREAAVAAINGSDVDNWLTFWWENNQPHEHIIFLDDVEEFSGDSHAGLHYDQYHGFCRDDI